MSKLHPFIVVYQREHIKVQRVSQICLAQSNSTVFGCRRALLVFMTHTSKLAQYARLLFVNTLQTSRR